MRRLGLPLALVLSLAACGSSETASPTEPEPPETATTAPEETTTAIVVYFMRGETVTPAHRELPQTAAVGTAAVEALLAGPTEAERALGVSSSVPEGTTLLGLEVAGGTATVDLSREFESGGGSLSMLSRLAQLVFTLTQFSTVDRVVLELEGEPVEALGGEGVLVDEPLTRDDFPDLTPLILVERPALGQTVTSPVRVSGTASVFEATLQVRLIGPDGEMLGDEVVTASEGAPGRGTFAVELPFSATGPGTVEAYTISAADGSEQHNIQVPVRLAP
ncbi:MAG: GerMN domain-containing protein [Thermoleophilia bacterium]|nr:GerMN domain-containing protein [Thermoleophilia bacterium]